MNNKLAIVTGSLVMALVACGSADDTTASPSPDSSSTDAPPQIPAATPEEAQPQDLIDDCEGRWLCTPCGEYQSEIDIYRDSRGRCILGGGIELGRGGAAQGVYEAKYGSWTGDSLSFHLEIKTACYLTPGIAEDAIDCRKKYW